MFGRSIGDEAEEEVHVDLSPMIDCIFILLIFFIVNVNFTKETGKWQDRKWESMPANLTSQRTAATARVSVNSMVSRYWRNRR